MIIVHNNIILIFVSVVYTLYIVHLIDGMFHTILPTQNHERVKKYFRLGFSWIEGLLGSTKDDSRLSFLPPKEKLNYT